MLLKSTVSQLGPEIHCILLETVGALSIYKDERNPL